MKTELDVYWAECKEKTEVYTSDVMKCKTVLDTVSKATCDLINASPYQTVIEKHYSSIKYIKDALGVELDPPDVTPARRLQGQGSAMISCIHICGLDGVCSLG